MQKLYTILKLRLLLTATAIVISISILAQGAGEVLNNKSVVEMYKAGLSKETVVSKIETSICKFDVTTTGLIALKKQGVPDDVINAMVNRGSSKAASAGNSLEGPLSSVSKLNIEKLNYVHTYYKDMAEPLEKKIATSESKRKMLGYGGNDLILEIGGITSYVKLTEDKAQSFIINMGSNNLPDLVLYKLKVEKGKRQALVGRLTISGPKSGDKTLPVEITKLSEGLFILKPGQKLDKGEYFFSNKPNINTSTSSAEVYAFSII